MIDRLRILTMSLILLMGSAVASAQGAGDVPVIGVLRASSATQHDPAMEAIRAELHALGYTEGRNIRIEQRFAKRVAVLHDPAGHDAEDLAAAGKQLGLQLRLVELKSPKEFEGAIKLAARNAQAAILLFSPMLFDYRIRLASLAAETRLPTMTQAREFVVAGALMSYAPNRTEVAARTAYFIDRLLRGATPGDLPVEEAATFKLTLNLKTAKALGIEIPQSILMRADEVIR